MRAHGVRCLSHVCGKIKINQNCAVDSECQNMKLYQLYSAERERYRSILGCLQPSLISLFYSLFSSNQIALFFLENRINVITPLQKSYC